MREGGLKFEDIEEASSSPQQHIEYRVSYVGGGARRGGSIKFIPSR
jgi:hypothetical protein